MIGELPEGKRAVRPPDFVPLAVQDDDRRLLTARARLTRAIRGCDRSDDDVLRIDQGEALHPYFVLGLSECRGWKREMRHQAADQPG